MRRAVPLLVSFALTYGAALVGSLFTAGAVATWYATLTRPELSPPDWLFGPVWTILYACMAVAAWRIYEKRKGSRRTHALLLVYGAHLAVNAFWSIAFFGLHSPTLGLAVLALLWALVAYLTVCFYQTDRVAGILFFPYLAWVSFASYLNLMIVLLN